MNVVNYYAALDMFDRTVKSSVYMRHADSGNRLTLTIHEGSKIYDFLDGTYATFIFTLPDGESHEIAAFVVNGRVVVVIPPIVTSQPGDVICQVKFYENDQGVTLIDTSPIFTIIVSDPASIEAGITPATAQSAYDNILATWEASQQALDVVTEAAETAADALETATDALNKATEAMRIATEVISSLVAITDEELAVILV